MTTTIKGGGKVIKFRVWDKVNKTMTDFGNFKVLQEESEGLLFFRQDSTPRSSDEVVLMQFTGLLDKHGNEVYEGAIVNLNPRPNGEKVLWIVGWNLEEGRWSLVYDTGEPARNINRADRENWEVVGDIYQNPDLIKG